MVQLRKTKHTVPADALSELPAGTQLLWRVVAVTEQGRRVHSTTFEVVIR